ncbi:ribosomal RNA assembly protein [Schistosoma bovis]|uniref:KRR-R motif-containing protein 1 n=1 Tax=Schistosoma bovis TaxID=6184 RepID=A0A430Q2J9_SCHBO|nr:ribosomal RNA assembly protein [Schistosoma bovis]
MGKKTNKQKLSFPKVQGWVPYKAFSAKKNEEVSEPKYAEVPKDWKEPKFTPEDNPHGRLFASSSYTTLFPKYREKYLSEIWPALRRIMMEHHIRVEIDVAESTMEVRTTPRTFDPFIILKARDVIRLLARSVPMEQAIRVLDDETFADIIEINLTNRERFVKRRNRLIGHDGETLKALELSTNCYIVVQGKTVSVVGRYNDLKEVRKKKEYNPFPPPPVQSKIDIELEKGTYFLAEAERKRLKVESNIVKSNQISKIRQKAKRSAALIPPDDQCHNKNNNNDNNTSHNKPKKIKFEE